ncbi:LLM class flavin-dependent oxidoreductase [Nonomuraea sp. NPDC050790]|uniref:LLM class flavin-dependent oxidoreductase n=1 Tax=Nonomuraea sp. NPDC050790 TaxID=3364371 RepID=UPI0037B9BA1C
MSTRIGLFAEPHRGATYDDQSRMVRAAERCGFESWLRADHYQTTDVGVRGEPGPTDAWVTLAGLARETSRIRIGTLVSCVTFRPARALAMLAAQVDRMSGGRVDLGIGAGWYEREHRAYGIPFPPRAARFDMLEEQLATITRIWPSATRPPIIVGGRGARRTPELAARYADEFNMPFASVPQTARAFRRVEEARGGRPPLVLSAGIVAAVGRDAAQISRRAAPLHAPSALPPEDPVIGPPGLLVERIGELAAAGATRVYVRLSDPADLGHLELIAAEVLPQVS